MATSLLAWPAFLESTQPTFEKYWGDWALISVSLFSAILWHGLDLLSFNTCDQVFYRDFTNNQGCEHLFAQCMIRANSCRKTNYLSFSDSLGHCKTLLRYYYVLLTITNRF